MIAESRTDSPAASSPLATDSAPTAPAAPVAAASAPVASAPAARADVEALQQQVFDLVRERVLATIGAGSNFQISLRRTEDANAFFDQTMADMIAWDVVAQLAPPAVPNRARLG